MKIILIGHSIIDHFDGPENEISRPGGIFYSLIGIFPLAKAEDEIFLLTGWNKDTFNLFEKLYSKTNLTLQTRLRRCPKYFSISLVRKKGKEVYKNLSSQLSTEKISDWNQFDGILINMITGFDISLDQLKTIRKKFNGTIYFDVHTLSRGVGINLNREFRPIPDINEWLVNIDILQCNENELCTIIQDKSEIESVAEILKMGVKIVIITKGGEGAHLFYNFGGETNSYFVNPIKIKAVNKVGCGDIFGAAFFYTYISSGDVIESLKLANKAGAAAASMKNITTQTILKQND